MTFGIAAMRGHIRTVSTMLVSHGTFEPRTWRTILRAIVTQIDTKMLAYLLRPASLANTLHGCDVPSSDGNMETNQGTLLLRPGLILQFLDLELSRGHLKPSSGVFMDLDADTILHLMAAQRLENNALVFLSDDLVRKLLPDKWKFRLEVLVMAASDNAWRIVENLLGDHYTRGDINAFPSSEVPPSIGSFLDFEDSPH